MKAQIWFIDVDGCLTPGKFKRLDVDALRELERLIHAQRLNVVLCTGRSLSYLEALHQLFDWGRYAISDHGALIYDAMDDRVQAHPRLTAAVREDLQRLQHYLSKAGELNGHWRLSHGKAASVSLVGQGCDALTLHGLIQNAYAVEGFELHASGRVLDIVPAGINKWEGARYFLQKHAAEDWITAAIGDSHGDLPLLGRVDYPCCPRNAHPDVQAICSLVSQERDAWGVLDILLQHYDLSLG